MTCDTTEPSLIEVKQKIVTAIGTLYRHDRKLLEVDANERTLTHKLAEHLQHQFPNWHVDCEYNRRGSDIKRLAISSWRSQPDDTEAKTVFPDVIVHQRLTTRNLIVIEVKKTTGHEDTKDIEKLKAFTEPTAYGYKYGFFLKLGPIEDSVFKVFEGGLATADWSDDLWAALKGAHLCIKRRRPR